MQPKKHKKQMERVETWAGRKRYLAVGFAFISITLLLGPLIHELAHMIVLQVISCSYNLDFSLGFTGLFGSVKPLCSPDSISLIVFYSAGYLTTFLTGVAASVAALEEGKNTFRQKLLAATGSGLLASTILSLSAKGDIANVVILLGLEPFYETAINLLILLSCSAAMLRSLEIFWDNSERQ